jgi:hypothetical protein
MNGIQHVCFLVISIQLPLLDAFLEHCCPRSR